MLKPKLDRFFKHTGDSRVCLYSVSIFTWFDCDLVSAPFHLSSLTFGCTRCCIWPSSEESTFFPSQIPLWLLEWGEGLWCFLFGEVERWDVVLAPLARVCVCSNYDLPLSLSHTHTHWYMMLSVWWGAPLMPRSWTRPLSVALAAMERAYISFTSALFAPRPIAAPHCCHHYFYLDFKLCDRGADNACKAPSCERAPHFLCERSSPPPVVSCFFFCSTCLCFYLYQCVPFISPSTPLLCRLALSLFLSFSLFCLSLFLSLCSRGICACSWYSLHHLLVTNYFNWKHIFSDLLQWLCNAAGLEVINGPINSNATKLNWSSV